MIRVLFTLLGVSLASLADNHQRGLLLLETVTRLVEQSFERVDELRLLSIDSYEDRTALESIGFADLISREAVLEEKATILFVEKFHRNSINDPIKFFETNSRILSLADYFIALFDVAHAYLSSIRGSDRLVHERRFLELKLNDWNIWRASLMELNKETCLSDYGKGNKCAVEGTLAMEGAAGLMKRINRTIDRILKRHEQIRVKVSPALRSLRISRVQVKNIVVQYLAMTVSDPRGFSTDKELLVRALDDFSADLETALEELDLEDEVVSIERELLATLTNSWKNICDTIYDLPNYT